MMAVGRALGASQRRLDLGLGLLWTKVTSVKQTTQESPCLAYTRPFQPVE